MSDPNNGAMTGADRLNHANAIGQQKFGSRGILGAGGISGVTHERPLFGIGEATASIIKNSGLGRQTSPGPTIGERMSDADEPAQGVEVDSGGATLKNGGRETPLMGYGASLQKAVREAPFYQA